MTGDRVVVVAGAIEVVDVDGGRTARGREFVGASAIDVVVLVAAPPAPPAEVPAPEPLESSPQPKPEPSETIEIREHKDTGWSFMRTSIMHARCEHRTL